MNRIQNRQSGYSEEIGYKRGTKATGELVKLHVFLWGSTETDEDNR
jgi:hypothetical protein